MKETRQKILSFTLGKIDEQPYEVRQEVLHSR